MEFGGETGLVRYDNMVVAIAAAVAADEAKEIKDQARALQIYFQQSHDFENERKAATIRIRAERRMGQLLKQQEKNKGSAGRLSGRDSPGTPIVRPPERKPPPTLKQQGISKHESSQAQRLADIPDEEFEYALAVHEATDTVPTSGGIIASVVDRRETMRQVAMSDDVSELIALLKAINDFDVVRLDATDLITRQEVHTLSSGASKKLESIWTRTEALSSDTL